MRPREIIFLSPIKAEDRPIVDPFRYLERQGLIAVTYVEFGFLGQLGMILRGKERSPVSRVFKNLARVLALFFQRDRILLLGTEPFRVLSLGINWLKARHRCIYHTSWAWDEETLTEPTWIPFRRRIWRSFLRDTISVSFTRNGCAGLTRHGARAFYVPHNVDTEIFHPAPDRPRKVPETIVLFAGNLERTKGIHLIIDVIRNYPWNGLTFWFAGRGRFEDEIERLERDGHPVRNVGFVRDRQQLADLYRSADMLILPSIQLGREEERFGMVLIEAMACGLPVIASDCAGPRQIIAGGEDGLLIPQNDGHALRESILRLASAPALRADMGRRGRKKAVDDYDVRIVARRWMEVIECAVAPDGQAVAIAEPSFVNPEP